VAAGYAHGCIPSGSHRIFVIRAKGAKRRLGLIGCGKVRKPTNRA
jgi:hypothetical protein